METHLYKSGQGYWTRTVTAIAGGVLILAGAFWVMQQIQLMRLGEYELYYQGAAALTITLVFGYMLYRWVGRKPKTCDFLIATEGEMKKVNWPTQKEVHGATRVVIFVVLCFMIVLYIADIAFATFFRYINVLEV